jgi:hypothetical protein
VQWTVRGCSGGRGLCFSVPDVEVEIADYDHLQLRYVQTEPVG